MSHRHATLCGPLLQWTLETLCKTLAKLSDCNCYNNNYSQTNNSNPSSKAWVTSELWQSRNNEKFLDHFHLFCLRYWIWIKVRFNFADQRSISLNVLILELHWFLEIIFFLTFTGTPPIQCKRKVIESLKLLLNCFRFLISNTDHIIDVNQGTSGHQHDQINIVCPKYEAGTPNEVELS